MALTRQQLNHFETFGFLKLPGLIGPRLVEVEAAFEDVLKEGGHDGTKRTTVVPFIDQDERLCSLLDDPAVLGAASSLLGSDFNYMAGDGNYYTGDTGWHSDGFHSIGVFLKFAIYLDAVTGATGALRVVPGSHRLDSPWREERNRVTSSEQELGIPGADVPAVALDSTPGDVLVFNHNLLHASFGGSSRRRMFTLNLSRRARDQQEIAELRAYVGDHGRFWNDSMFGEIMVGTASPERRVHLEQVLANQDHLPELVRQAREQMVTPSNN